MVSEVTGCCRDTSGIVSLTISVRGREGRSAHSTSRLCISVCAVCSGGNATYHGIVPLRLGSQATKLYTGNYTSQSKLAFTPRRMNPAFWQIHSWASVQITPYGVIYTDEQGRYTGVSSLRFFAFNTFVPPYSVDGIADLDLTAEAVEFYDAYYEGLEALDLTTEAIEAYTGDYDGQSALEVTTEGTEAYSGDYDGEADLELTPEGVDKHGANYSGQASANITTTSAKSYGANYTGQGSLNVSPSAGNSFVPGGILTCSSCSAGAWGHYYFTLSGVTNGSCSTCSTLNTTFTLNYTTACTWQSDMFTLCGSSNKWTFRKLTPGNEWQLALLTGAITYSSTFGSATWDCQSDMNLSRTLQSLCNCPGTITISNHSNPNPPPSSVANHSEMPIRFPSMLGQI